MRTCLIIAGTRAVEHPLKLILASGSPRRKQLLESMGLAFSVLVTDVDETHQPGESPQNYVRRLAQTKAQAALTHIAEQQQNEHVILAADTIVCQGQEIFSKPKDQEDACRIWRQLSDSQHQVITAVSLLTHGNIDTRSSVTDVEFSTITESQMAQYWASGEPTDKAGAYAIQGGASAWVKLIHGSYTNVVGLPLYEVNQMLGEVNLNWL